MRFLFLLSTLVLVLVSVLVHAGANIDADEVLRVHICPHTHDDVGWLKTVDQYYVGANNNIQRAGVRTIIDTVVRSLLEDETRRFMYVEVAFFERWWTEQTQELQDKVKVLVKEKRLEFINGGWCMNDEAAVYYQSMIDQMSLGLRWLNDTFDVQPNIAWAIDPFGHSSQQASALADMGMDVFVLGRIDDQDRQLRRKEQRMEFVWNPSRSLGESNALLGAITPEGYYPLPGFDVDESSNSEPFQDRHDLDDFNADEKAASFAESARKWAAFYGGKQLMITQGGDFHFSNAQLSFSNLDRVIKYFSEHPEYNLEVFYSTPSKYFEERYAATQSTTEPLTEKTDDFFPYGTGSGHSMWTGYFTSRAALKGYERSSNAHLQVCKQLSLLTGIDGDNFPLKDARVDTLRRAMAVLQHHDGVSGTEKQAVQDDYAKRVSIGNDKCDEVIDESLKLMTGRGWDKDVSFTRCGLLNVSRCSVSQDATEFKVLLYNSMGQSRREHLRIPVKNASWTVTKADGSAVPAQLSPTHMDAALLTSSAPMELHFVAEVPPVGFNTYKVSSHAQKATTTETTSANARIEKHNVNEEDVVVDNGKIRVTFRAGLLKSIENIVDGSIVNINQQWMFYESHAGTDGYSPSGAYIFRPQTTEATEFSADGIPIEVERGPLFTQVRQVFGAYVAQTVRIYDDDETVEVEFSVGPINVTDGIGREIITRFATDLDTKGVFYTDSNGREMQKRRINHRPSWPVDIKEPAAANYYPMNAAAFLRDQNAQFTVLSDRSQGVACVTPNQLEVMVHRRTLHDDHLGVAEPLNEPGLDGHGLVIRGVHRLLVSRPRRAAALQRELMERIAQPLEARFAAGAPMLPFPSLSYLQHALPPNLHLVTLDRIANDAFMLRIGHMYALEEDEELSVPVTITLSSLFDCISTADELSLGGNQRFADMKRRRWTTATRKTEEQESAEDENARLTFTLRPMQIRTWKITYSASACVTASSFSFPSSEGEGVSILPLVATI